MTLKSCFALFTFVFGLSHLVFSSWVYARGPKPIALESHQAGSNDSKIKNVNNVLRRGHCSILYPNKCDAQNRRCNHGNYGILYKKHFIEDKCYLGIDAALSVLEMTSACDEEDTLGDCAILYPGQKDKQGRMGPYTRFGVTYNRYLTEDTFYSSFEEALNAMKNTRVCHFSANGKKKQLPADEAHQKLNCPICLESMQTDSDFVVGACQHQFHSSCLFRYCKYIQRPTCPLCQVNLEKR